MFFLKKSYSFSCLRDTFQDKSIPFPLQCTFAFLPYAPRKMLIQQLCNKDHVMRTILCKKGRPPPKEMEKNYGSLGGGGVLPAIRLFLPFLKDHVMRIILCLKDHVAMMFYDKKLFFPLKICLNMPKNVVIFAGKICK